MSSNTSKAIKELSRQNYNVDIQREINERHHYMLDSEQEQDPEVKLNNTTIMKIIDDEISMLVDLRESDEYYHHIVDEEHYCNACNKFIKKNNIISHIHSTKHLVELNTELAKLTPTPLKLW